LLVQSPRRDIYSPRFSATSHFSPWPAAHQTWATVPLKAILILPAVVPAAPGALLVVALEPRAVVLAPRVAFLAQVAICRLAAPRRRRGAPLVVDSLENSPIQIPTARNFGFSSPLVSRIWRVARRLRLKIRKRTNGTKFWQLPTTIAEWWANFIQRYRPRRTVEGG